MIKKVRNSASGHLPAVHTFAAYTLVQRLNFKMKHYPYLALSKSKVCSAAAMVPNQGADRRFPARGKTYLLALAHCTYFCGPSALRPRNNIYDAFKEREYQVRFAVNHVVTVSISRPEAKEAIQLYPDELSTQPSRHRHCSDRSISCSQRRVGLPTTRSQVSKHGCPQGTMRKPRDLVALRPLRLFLLHIEYLTFHS